MSETEDNAERLTEAVIQLSDDICGLMEVVEQGSLLTQLVEEIRTLRTAVDDVRSDIEWAARNIVNKDADVPQFRPIHSMPRDPCDPRFAERLNAVSREDLPTTKEQDVAEGGTPSESIKQEDDAEVTNVSSESIGPQESALDGEPQPPATSGEQTDHPHEEGTSDRENSSTSPYQRSAGDETSATHATKPQPLHLRLYFQRHMSELVRLVGHEQHRMEEFLSQLEPFYEEYGEQKVKAALDELVSVTHRKRERYISLKPEVRQLAVQMIGRPPAGKS